MNRKIIKKHRNIKEKARLKHTLRLEKETSTRYAPGRIQITFNKYKYLLYYIYFIVFILLPAPILLPFLPYSAPINIEKILNYNIFYK